MAGSTAIKIDTNLTDQRLLEIQKEKQEICQPRYHEFHRNTFEKGFIKITIPQRKQH